MSKPLTHTFQRVMLTSEVVNIFKKLIVLSLVLGLTVCSHLRPVLDFTVSGQRLSTECTPAAAKAAREAALAAAEEILPGHAAEPEYCSHRRLSFRPGADTAPLLGDALLQAQPGVISASLVYADKIRLGAVADAAQFRADFARYIDNTLPTWAKGGSVRGMTLIPRYTRAEFEIPNEDMILLVTGLSPVMYYDGKGRVSPV